MLSQHLLERYLIPPSEFQVSNAPAGAPSSFRLDFPNDINDDRVFGDVTEEATRNPKRLDGIVQAAMVRVRERDAADPTRMPQ